MRYRYKVFLNVMGIGALILLGFFTWEGNASLASQKYAVPGKADAGPFPQYSEGLRNLFPDFASLEKTGDQVYRIRDGGGKELGSLWLETVPEEQKKIGYAGPVEVAVAFRGNRVAGVLIGRNEETPGFLARVAERGLLRSWNGAGLKEIPSMNVDAVSGATMSSEAIIDGVRKLAEGHLLRMEQKASGGHSAGRVLWYGHRENDE